MKLIVCLDNKQGMLFNHRRQSRDRHLIADLVMHVEGKPLYITDYSKPLFDGQSLDLRVVDDPIGAAKNGDYCLLETFDPAPYADRIDELVIYRWNRHYPADVYFTLSLDAYTLESSVELVGSSHEKITKEVWKK